MTSKKYYPLPNINEAPEAIILANGDFPTHPIPKALLYQHQDRLYCCDGAANILAEKNLLPKAIIGDGDSLSPENKEKYQPIFTQIPDQNTNDLTKTILYCTERSIQSIVVVGATGKREDHTIANIGLLIRYLSIVENLTMITDHGVFNAIRTPSIFQSYKGQQVSLFSMHPTPITSTNLKYELHDHRFDSWSQGTLNEAVGDDFTIEVNDPLIVYRVFNNCRFI